VAEALLLVKLKHHRRIIAAPHLTGASFRPSKKQ
jgi:hypothetical protein